MQVRAQIIELESKHAVENIEDKTWCFEITNEIANLLERIIQEKIREKATITNNRMKNGAILQISQIIKENCHFPTHNEATDLSDDCP